MDDLEDFDPKKIKFDLKNFKEGGISWFTRFLLRFWPLAGVRRLTKELGMDPDYMEKADELYSSQVKGIKIRKFLLPNERRIYALHIFR